MNAFLTSDVFMVEQKSFSVGSQYTVFDENGAEIGHIVEDHALLRVVMELFIKGRVPFSLHLEDNEKNVLVSVRKNFSMFMANFDILDADGQVIGTIKQDFSIKRSSFEILGANGDLIATIKGDWNAWHLNIITPEDGIIAAITKRFGSAMKELFTSYDKYRVKMCSSVPDEKLRLLVIALSAVMDKFLHD